MKSMVNSVNSICKGFVVGGSLCYILIVVYFENGIFFLVFGKCDVSIGL